MEKSMAAEPAEDEAAQLHKGIRRHLAEIEQLRACMKSVQAEIDASGMRTDIMLRQIKAQMA